jgi:gliding motility-associated-like protein
MNKLILIILILWGVNFSATSNHIVGGDSWVEQIGRNTFRISAKFYRKCDGGGSSMPRNMSLRFFDNITNVQIGSSLITPRVGLIDTLTFGDSCFTNAQVGLCVSVGLFVTTVTLPDNPNGYYFSYRTPPNRSNSILNIVSSSSNIWYAQIPNPALVAGNSSPKFVDYPMDAYLCVNNEKDIDYSCIDPDGDSLVYSLITPYDNTQPGGTRPFILVNWIATPQHNLLNILGPGTSCVIDSRTGIVTGRTGRLGEYVIAVKCEEFRNGIKIGEVIRDMVVKSLNCNYDSPPLFDISEDPILIKFEKDTCFDVLAVDQDFSDIFYLQVNSNSFSLGASVGTTSDSTYTWKDAAGNLTTTSGVAVTQLSGNLFQGVGKVGVEFCWKPTKCDIISIDSFYVEFYGYSIGCSGNSDSIYKRIPIIVERAEYTHLVPNVFSPNGDGINDKYFLKKEAYDKCYDLLNIRIYNRWGQNVFESPNTNFEWDGNDESGNPLSAGSYFVILQGYYGGKEVTQNFPITLFR